MRELNILKQIGSKSPEQNILDGLSSKTQDKPASNYDNLFDQYEVREGNLDLSNRDYISGYENPETYAGGVGLNEIRANNQGSFDKGLKGVGRAILKAGTEIEKIPGVLTGIIGATGGQIVDAVTGEDNTNFMESAFNNAWIQSANSFNEDVNNEYLPVYVKKAVSEGNLWDNISSVDFWATDGADGIGYIAAMMAPGAILKGLGAGSALSKIPGLRGAISASQIDTGVATVANTILEAGSEAGSAMDNFQKDIDSKLANEEISELEYNRLLEQKPILGRDVFLSNAAILVGPNFLQSKMLFGKTANKGISKLFGDKGELIDTVINPKWYSKVGNRTLDIAKATGSEGFFEEGLQTTVENMFSESASKGELTNNFFKDFNLDEVKDNYLDTISSTDGQKAIFLGGFLGGGMSAVHGAKQDIRDRKDLQNLINIGNNAIDSYYNVLNTNIYSNDGTIDPEAAIKKLASKDTNDRLSVLYEQAVANGDTETTEKLRELASTQLAYSFVMNDQLGLDILQEHLNQSAQLQDIADKENQSGNNITKEDIIKNVMDKAKSLEKAYSSYQDFAPTLLQDNLQQLSKVSPELSNKFYNQLAQNYINNKAQIDLVSKELNKSKDQYSDVLEDLGYNRNINIDPDNYSVSINQPEKTDLDKLESSDERLRKSKKDIQDLSNTLSKLKEVDSNFWKKDIINKNAKQFEKENKELIEKFSQENIDKLNSKLETINNATTQDELDNQNSDNPVVNQRVQDKRNQLNEEKQVVDNETKQLNKDLTNSVNDNLNLVRETSQVGDEFIPIPGLNIIPRLQNKELVVSKITPTSITVTEKNGKISQTFNIKQVDNNKPIHQFESEGSDTTEETKSIKETKSVEDKGVKVVSTNAADNYNPLSFIPESFIEFERNPNIKKVGQSVNFEINEKATSDEKWVKALNIVKGDLSGLSKEDIDHLINFLPINVVFNESTRAPIHTAYKSTNNTFEATTRNLRKIIINEIIKGSTLDSITTTIEGQYNGQLALEDTVVENLLKNLYEFGDNENNIKSSNIFLVDDQGTLSNSDGLILAANRPLAPGELYLKIHTANGSEFPLKLNTRKITIPQAEVLYELYKYRFQDIQGIPKATLLKEIDNDELKDLIKANLQDELEVIGTKFEDISIKDIIDFLIFDGTDNPKSRMKFSNTREGVKLLVLDREFTAEELELSKAEFMDLVTNNKRQNIKFKSDPSKGLSSININNRKYLNYLINNGILNTNVKVDGPSFRGNTSIFLNQSDIRVNGELSKFYEQPKKKPVKDTNISTNELAGVKIEGPQFDLSQFGINIPKKEVTKPISKPKEIVKEVSQTVNPYKANESLIAEGSQQMSQGKFVLTNYENDSYYITFGVNQNSDSGSGFHVFKLVNSVPKSIISNKDTVIKIVKGYNSKLPVGNQNRLNENNVEKIWNSRINSVSLSEEIIKPVSVETIDKESDMIDFDKVTVEQSQKFLTTVMKELPGRFNQEIVLGAKNPKTTFENVYKQIEESNELSKSLETIRKKCNL